jgi:hypothetical protein
VRKVFVLLLALVLMPSIVMASTYRCRIDGTARSECCCPAPKHAPSHDRRGNDSTTPSMKAACCCTITHSESTASDRGSMPSSFEFHPQIVATTYVFTPFAATTRSVPLLDRPRAQGDPPISLFSLRCSLLI